MALRSRPANVVNSLGGQLFLCIGLGSKFRGVFQAYFNWTTQTPVLVIPRTPLRVISVSHHCANSDSGIGELGYCSGFE